MVIQIGLPFLRIKSYSDLEKKREGINVFRVLEVIYGKTGRHLVIVMFLFSFRLPGHLSPKK